MERHMDNIKEVTAWAVVDKADSINLNALHRSEARANVLASRYNANIRGPCEYRVIRVRIVPDTEEQK
jgi:hypothetical protein